jgi:hypothetical protein
MPMTTGATTYEAAWKDYRRRRFWFILAFVGYTPGCAVLGITLESLFHSDIPVYIVAVLWMLGFWAAWLRMIFFRCPCCGKHFFWQDAIFKKVFTPVCVHCGLPKWANSIP